MSDTHHLEVGLILKSDPQRGVQAQPMPSHGDVMPSLGASEKVTHVNSAFKGEHDVPRQSEESASKKKPVLSCNLGRFP